MCAKRPENMVPLMLISNPHTNGSMIIQEFQTHKTELPSPEFTEQKRPIKPKCEQKAKLHSLFTLPYSEALLWLPQHTHKY